MDHQKIIVIKSEIDNIKEYIDTEICRKCSEMTKKLDHLYELLENSIKENYTQ